MRKPYPRITVAGGRAEHIGPSRDRRWMRASGGAAALLAVAACASVAHGQKLIRACESPSRDRGELHVLAGAGCTSSERELSWNKAGVRGPVGPQGLPGLRGPRCEGAKHPHASCRHRSHKRSAQSVLKTIIEVAGTAVGAVLAILLAPLVIGLAVLHALTRIPYVKDSYLVRHWRRTSFIVETLDDNALDQRIGPAITGLVRNRISVRGDRYGLDYVTGQRIVREKLEPFKDLSASFQNLSGTAGTAVAVIDFLAKTLPRRRFVLRGELQPAGSAGPGVSLALQDNSAEDSLTVLWATPLEVRTDGVAAYQRLAIPAAAWADHRLTSALAKGVPSELLSSNADSWAFFRAGLECHRIGEDEAARSLYEQALGHDGSNLGALANLGLLERRERHFARAEELLMCARNEFEGRGEPHRHNPDWYRIRYQLAALYLNRASLHDGTARLNHDVEAALEESRALACVSAEMIVGPEDEPSIWRQRRIGQSAASLREEHRELLDFLKTTIAPSALTLLAGALQADGQQPSPRAHPPIELHSYEDVRQALKDPELDGEALVKFVEKRPQLAPRVYYNLACYQTTRRRRQRATESLERAFLHTTITERNALLRVVEKDATLDPLTADAKLMERLREYLSPRV